ncbi:Uncharacterized protein TCM_012400 [Theobroma cacao]|uniref:Uncharacterized protein n=1 Tax=Theobroma cacao TaxID=3641 RepID=A0A061FU98_THECC|nr:Uncharacterized protein TCM_012400 [Theobroma cacao]
MTMGSSWNAMKHSVVESYKACSTLSGAVYGQDTAVMEGSSSFVKKISSLS